MRTILYFSLCIAASAAIAQSYNAQLPGMSPDGKHFSTPPPQSPWTPDRINPYTHEPLKSVTRANTALDRTIEIPIPLNTLTLVRLKTPKNSPIAPEQIYLSAPEYFNASVIEKSPHKTILFRSRISDPTALPAASPKQGAETGTLRDSVAYVETAKGVVTLRLIAIPARNTPSNWEVTISDWGQEDAAATTTSSAFDEVEQFDYRLNQTPKSPLNYRADEPTERSVAGGGLDGQTDRKSPSPEARSFNPYDASGQAALSYYQPELTTGPEITTDLLPTAISMMRRYDEQRTRAVTTPEMIERINIGKRYRMNAIQDIYLAEAYRFPKYQSTALRIQWHNDQTTPQFLDPQKIALKIGRFLLLPTVFGQSRNVVFPGQNNELYLIYRIPNAEAQQNYELVLPTATAPVRSIHNQPLPAKP